jgi:hypothetical protein
MARNTDGSHPSFTLYRGIRTRQHTSYHGTKYTEGSHPSFTLSACPGMRTRQHTSENASIRQHTSANVSAYLSTAASRPPAKRTHSCHAAASTPSDAPLPTHNHARCAGSSGATITQAVSVPRSRRRSGQLPAYISIRQHTRRGGACTCICQHTSAYVSIRGGAGHVPGRSRPPPS